LPVDELIGSKTTASASAWPHLSVRTELRVSAFIANYAGGMDNRLSLWKVTTPLSSVFFAEAFLASFAKPYGLSESHYLTLIPKLRLPAVALRDRYVTRLSPPRGALVSMAQR